MDQKHSFILDMYMLKPIKKIGKLWYNYSKRLESYDITMYLSLLFGI